MERLIERCCGLDVHKATVSACVRVTPRPGGKIEQEVRTFATLTAELLALRDWLTEQRVTHVAMEATGVYWKPVYYVLENDFELLLVNPAHFKQVPGRKTDVADCAWLAQLLQYGLLRGSFVPPAPIRELRDLTRYRKSLTEERTRAAKSTAQGAAGCRHQALQRRNRHAGSIRSLDADGAGSWHHGPGVAGRLGPRQTAQEAP
jgi:transposase